MKKQLVFLIGMMLLFSIMPMVIAQDPNERVVIPEGDIISSDFITLEIVLSTTLGGLISTIGETIRETVNLGGVPVHIIEQVNGISDFEILAFDSRISPNFEAMTIGTIFQTSEEVNVRGITSVWETYNVDTLLPAYDDQSYVIATGTIFLDTGHIYVSECTLSFIYGWDDGVGGTGINTIGWTACEDSENCPSVQELIDYGILNVGKLQYAIVVEMGDLVVLRMLTEGGSVIGLLGDLNNDGQWNFVEFTASGYSVVSQQGQTLMLLPATETFDIYAII